MLSEPILVVARIAQALDNLGIPYIVGGSLASSVYGIPRATQDVDLVADINLSHVDAFTDELSATDSTLPTTRTTDPTAASATGVMGSSETYLLNRCRCRFTR